MIRKVKARFVRNPRRSDRKIAHELNISRERMQHVLKNELGLKSLKFQKVQKLTDGQKKSETGKRQGVTLLARKWPVTKFVFLHSKLSSLWTNKIIGLTCQRGQLKTTTAIGHQNSSAAEGNGTGRRIARWSLLARQNKCRILSGKCLQKILKPWADKHFGCRQWTLQ